MKQKYYIDALSDETLAKMIDETLRFEKNQNQKRGNFKMNFLKIIPVAACILLLIGLINVLPIFQGTDVGVGSEGIGQPDIEISLPTGYTTEDTTEVDRYAHVRFGETRDILLLDVEWHTYDTWLAEIEELKDYYNECRQSDYYINKSDEEKQEWENTSEEYLKSMDELANEIKDQKIYMARTINGKRATGVMCFSDMAPLEIRDYGCGLDINISEYLDPDGYYIFNIYEQNLYDIVSESGNTTLGRLDYYSDLYF